MIPVRLITIPFSHYCEKARWALDAAGVDYREEPHPPLAHLPATRAVGGRSVPVLVHGEHVFRDSTDIVRHADDLAPPDRHLFPAEAEARTRVLAIEDELDETLGVDARLISYWHHLADAERARAFVGRMMGVRSRIAQRLVAPLFRALIFRRYEVSGAAARRAEARVRSTFARLRDAIETEGYLVAGRFTLADLTLASLATPLLAPPEHPIMGQLQLSPPPELAALRADLSATPAGRHILRVYRDHRRLRSAPREGVGKRLLIDGQQRLTTLMIRRG